MIGRGVSFVFLLAMLMVANLAQATHIRAGEITIERRNCQSLTFTFFITGYIDPGGAGCGGQVPFGGGTMDFGDGSEPVEIIDSDPRVTAILIEDPLGECLAVTRFMIEHTYSSNGTYIVTYNENNRNDGILNMDNSVNTPFFVESILRIDPLLGCNNSPVMLIPPIDFGCAGVAFYHNPGAYDPDGDSLAFEFVTPRKAVDTQVDNYRPVNDPSFGGVVESGSLPATLSIDPVTGDIVWDAPALGFEGEYNLAFIVKEYRKRAGQYFLIGAVVRDMQIIIKECENNRPELDIPDDICVEAGTNIQEVIRATDMDGDPVRIEVLSAVLHFQDSPATFDPDPPVFQQQPGEVLFQWQTTCEHIREQPYLVHFKVTDQPPEGVALVEFGTMNVTVVAPSPKGLTSQVNNDRTIDLTWDPYMCPNAESLQIWRRIDSYSFTPDECETGMPDRAGYTLIDVIDASETSYKDNDNGSLLNFGARYCYRLVSEFALPQGGESYVSNEACDIIIANGPVITHVTVDETSETDGKITVSWRGPFEIDQAVYPPPYSYELWRGTGLVGTADTEVELTLPSDTTIQDTGLDTKNQSYHYVVKLFDGSGTYVRESTSASQVRLEPTPLLGAIELNWNARVPWTNHSQTYPMHYIYRDNALPGNAPQIVLIDSVEVTTDGFFYADDGSFNGIPLDDQTDYCYYVQTQGTYGNPNILAPQVNLSQIICARPNDTIPPCKPELYIDLIDCESFLADRDCNFSNFFNIIYWAYDFSIDECDEELKGYNIYFSPSGVEDTFVFLDFVTDTTYLHTGLNSFIGCYYITAVDRSNNESEPSEIVCNDNCPYYKLPNIITPNDDGFNDTFRPFDEFSPDANAQCPRFVVSVKFSVFNRWGGLLYQYESGGENTININWDGRDSNGKMVPSGNYFYSADVVFDVRDPSEREQTLTGWLQILY